MQPGERGASGLVSSDAFDTVILAGSGRSGTSWLGSILSSYEKAEYFYEITAFPGLDFGAPELMRVKYPLTHAWSARPGWVAKAERDILKLRRRWGPGKAGAQRSLRVFPDQFFVKDRPDVELHKVVTLFGFAMRREELAARYGSRLKVVHLIRNPFAQIASELKIDARDPQRAKKHFRDRVGQILAEPALEMYHECSREALGRDWVFQMALVWRVSNELLLRDRLLNKTLVTYERLCREPHRVVEELFEFLGWPLSEQTRRYVDETSAVEASEAESGLFSLRKNADESLNRWREELGEGAYRTALDALAASELMQLWAPEELQLRA